MPLSSLRCMHVSSINFIQSVFHLGIYFLRLASPRRAVFPQALLLRRSTRLALWLPAPDAPCPDAPSLAGMLPLRPLVLQRLCSRFHLSLLVLVFNVLLLVAICVTGSQSEGLRAGAALGAGIRAALGPVRATIGERQRQWGGSAGAGQGTSPWAVMGCQVGQSTVHSVPFRLLTRSTAARGAADPTGNFQQLLIEQPEGHPEPQLPR